MGKFSRKNSARAQLTRALSSPRSLSSRPSRSSSMEGWLRKRTTKSGVRKVWCERYFVLRGSSLSYYVRQIDVEAKATFQLAAGCKVSEIYLGSRKEKSSGNDKDNKDDTVHNIGERDDGSMSVADADASSPEREIKTPSKKEKKKGKLKEKLYCIKITWPAKYQSRDEKEADRVVEAITETTSRNNSRAASLLSQTPNTPVPTTTSVVTGTMTGTPGRSSSAVQQRRPSGSSVSTTGDNTHHMSLPLSPNAAPLSPPRSSPRATSLLAYSSRNTKSPPRLPLNRSHSVDETSTPDSSNEQNKILSPNINTSHRDSSVEVVANLSSPRSVPLSYKPSAPMSVSPTPLMSASINNRNLSSPTSPAMIQRSSTITEGVPVLPNLGVSHHTDDEGSIVSAPAIPTVLSSDSAQNNNKSTSDRLKRHYEEQMIIQRKEEEEDEAQQHASASSTTNAISRTTSQKQQEEMYKMLYLAAKKATQKKYKKKVVMGTKIAAATGAAITAGALTAGVGLVAGLVFVGIAGGLSGTGAAAGAALGRGGPGNKKLVLAANNLEDAVAWKEALEAAIAELAAEEEEDNDVQNRELLVLDGGENEEDTSSTWKHMYEKEGRSTILCAQPTPGERTENAIETVRSFEGDSGTAVGVGAAAAAAAAGTKATLRKDSGIGKVGKGGQTGSIFEPGTRWRPLEMNWATLLGTGAHGLRIFCEEKDPESSSNVRKIFRSRVGVEGHPSPPLKAHVVVNASPLNTFMCLMSNGRITNDGDDDDDDFPLVPNSGQVASFRVVKTLDDHMDIIQLVMRPLYLFPSWTAPRDFVLVRYWRLEPDGTYIVCYDSIEHRDCPPTPGYVRGGLHSVVTIAPRKRSRRGHSECLLTHVAQVDPHGWVPTFSLPFLSNHGYVEAFQVSALLQMIDVRDALDHDRFVPVSLDARPHNHWSSLRELYTQSPEEQAFPSMESEKIDAISRTSSVEMEEEDEEEATNYDFAYANHEVSSKALCEQKTRFSGGASVMSAPESVDALTSNTISNDPPPLLMDWWSEPDANSFRVRGKMYKKDKKKINAGSTLFRLIATDIISVDASIFDGICNHPQERVQRALKREKKLKAKGLPSDMPPFVVCVNIVLPGPPYYHFATYYAVDDMSLIDGSDGTPSSKLANEFIFGDSDEFRHKTFKLIPQIVEGNFIVRKAVGSTPAIMGTKLKQTYVRTDRFFEIVLDVGSSSVAAGVIRICNSYAKHIVADLAFLLEGNDESTLPEKIFGTLRLKGVEFGKKLRFLQTDDVEVDDE